LYFHTETRKQVLDITTQVEISSTFINAQIENTHERSVN